jgi:hypothetical protein
MSDPLGGEHPLQRAVRVGVGRARIVTVTPEHLVNYDQDGSEHHLDLPRCTAHWVRWHEEHAGDFVFLPGVEAQESHAWNARCVESAVRAMIRHGLTFEVIRAA